MSFADPNNPMPNLTFSPSISEISAISQSNPCVVTTVEDHDYVVGQQIKFFFPVQYGMQQLSGQSAYISALTADTFTVPIDSSQYNAFAIPTLPQYVVIDPALVIPIGDANTGTTNPGGVYPIPNTVPGSYQEIS